MNFSRKFVRSMGLCTMTSQNAMDSFRMPASTSKVVFSKDLA